MNPTQFRLTPQDDLNFTVEFELSSIPNLSDDILEQTLLNKNEIEKLQEIINSILDEKDILNKEINRLTNDSDKLDYFLAVSSGIFTGLIDSIIIGETHVDMEKALPKIHENVNKHIIAFAQKHGYKGNRLSGAINKLEHKFPIPNDNIWKNLGEKISAKNHHLADIAHHPTPLGLLASLVVSFFRVGLFVDRDGKWVFTFVDEDKEKLYKNIGMALLLGLLQWLINIATEPMIAKAENNLPKWIVKLLKFLIKAPVALIVLKSLTDAIQNWHGHLVSDMGGSKNTPGAGMGIPGFFISIFYELSAIPPFNMTGLPEAIRTIYEKMKIDSRVEKAFLSEIVSDLGRQAIPVLVNELFVRTFYSIRRLLKQFDGYSNINDIKWSKINWQEIIPFNNRTIVRMMTIATGTFSAIDLVDASYQASKKSCGNIYAAATLTLLRINFVGLGRFTLAIGEDTYMGYHLSKKISDRMILNNRIIWLLNLQLSYYHENMWLAAKETDATMRKLRQDCINFIKNQNELILSAEKNISTVRKNLEKSEEKRTKAHELLKEI